MSNTRMFYESIKFKKKYFIKLKKMFYMCVIKEQQIEPQIEHDFFRKIFFKSAINLGVTFKSHG